MSRPNAERVHMVLAAAADPTTRLIAASGDELAARLDCSRRSVAIAINDLVADGHVQIAREPRPRYPAVYRVIQDPITDPYADAPRLTASVPA